MLTIEIVIIPARHNILCMLPLYLHLFTNTACSVKCCCMWLIVLWGYQKVGDFPGKYSSSKRRLERQVCTHIPYSVVQSAQETHGKFAVLIWKVWEEMTLSMILLPLYLRFQWAQTLQGHQRLSVIMLLSPYTHISCHLDMLWTVVSVGIYREIHLGIYLGNPQITIKALSCVILQSFLLHHYSIAMFTS